MRMDDRPPREADERRTDSPSTVGPRLSSAELFNGFREVIIEHDGEFYRLRHTSRGKLILTK
jgi:hemin uptake protein HemP